MKKISSIFKDNYGLVIVVLIIGFCCIWQICSLNIQSIILQDDYTEELESQYIYVCPGEELRVGEYTAFISSPQELALYIENESVTYEVKIQNRSSGEGVSDLNIEKNDKYTDIQLNGAINISKNDVIDVYIIPNNEDVKIYCDEDGNAIGRFIYRNNLSLKKEKAIILICTAFVLFLSFCGVVLIKDWKNKFTYFLSLWGLIFILVVPYSWVSDDIYHFGRIFEISEGYIMSPDRTNPNEIKISPDNLSMGLDYGSSYSDVLENIDTELDYDNMTIYGFNNVALYSPIAYLPQIVGTLIGRLITSNVFCIILFSRLAALIFSVVVLRMAVGRLPINKAIVIISAFAPIFINQMVSDSLDSFVNSFIILFQALILSYVVNDKKLNAWQLIFMWIAPFILGMCKVVYLPFSLLIILVPGKLYGGKRTKIINITSSYIIAIVAYFTWTITTSPFIDRFAGVDSKGQIEYVLHYPIRYIGVLFNTISEKGSFYFWGVLGQHLGWIQNVFINNNYLIIFLLILVIYIVLQPSSENVLNKRIVLCYFIIIALIIMLTFAALYVQFNQVGAEIIDGIQGRYFIPIILPVSILLSYIVKLFLEKNRGVIVFYDKDKILLPDRYVYMFITWMELSMCFTFFESVWH